MAGHSKWANRKHRKARQDAKKGKIFSRMAREITVAARQGGGDPETNSVLRMTLERARQYGVPNENIERAIKRGTGELEGADYQEFLYEGYGPAGVALMLRVVTDNRNRVASDLRNVFARYGGNLGEAGCVAWMFERKGLLVINDGSCPVSEDDLLLAALEAGAEDLKAEGDTYEVVTPPETFEDVRRALTEAGVEEFAFAELTQIPQSTVPVDGKDAARLLKLLDDLDDHDDVQDVYGNYDIAEEVMAAHGA